ncbi:MAG: sialate O-acetylesterase [Planctomycetota bacterium]|nr:sialate O-acetylesterase [Planctomycetota bacterium]
MIRLAAFIIRILPSAPNALSRGVVLLSVMSLGPALTCAAVVPARIFSDHMVLQCDLAVPVWGKAEAGATVTVLMAGQSIETRADRLGKWQVTLKPMKANALGSELVIRSGGDRIVIRDVLVGEVWFAGGQSNMAYTAGQMAKHLPEGKALVESAALNGVRFRKVNERNSPNPRDDLSGNGSWDVCSPRAVRNHSAVAFVFADRIHRELKVPVGVIDCSWGGTPIEPYIPATAFAGHPTLEKLAALARSGNVEAIKAMRGGTFVRSPAWLAGAIYNGRVAPVAPYAVRGALWYQGESNSGRGEDPRDYAHKMRALIKGWRNAWGRKDLPFFYVQLPQWKSYAWTYLREEQRKALDVANTGMAVTIDLDNANDIHPPNKIDVGQRLASWSLAKVYSRDVTFSGPLFRKATISDESISVNFDHAGDGLIVGHVAGVGKVVEAKGTKLNGFELVGSDGAWRDAQAKIVGQKVVVSCRDVKRPIAVRYACHPQTSKDRPWNLYNKAGLPASPFCSDWNLMPYDPARNPNSK